MDGEGTVAVEAGWEVRQDEGSGQVYYWNAVTGETSWEPPPHLVATDELLSTEELALPWTRAHDDNGRVYYLNTETMETRWTPPTAGEQQDDVSVMSDIDVLAVTGGRGRRPSTAEQMNELNRLLSGEDDEESPEEGVDDDVDQQEASEMPPTVVQGSPQPSENAVADTEACTWMMFVNDDDGVPYYYNHLTGECLWDPPEEFLRFHHEQQQELQQQQLDGEAAPTTGGDIPANKANSDDTPASDGRGPNDVMQAAITPEFQEKVRQAIAAVSNTPVGSSRLVLVCTPTQQQLAQRTRRSAGESASARSSKTSSRPRSGPSRPSSGGAVSRPRTAAEGVTLSRLDPVPTVEVSSTLEEEIAPSAGEDELQGATTVTTAAELPIGKVQSDEDQFHADSQAESVEEVQNGDAEVNEEEAKIKMSDGIDVVTKVDVVEDEIGDQYADFTKAEAHADASLDNGNDSPLNDAVLKLNTLNAAASEIHAGADVLLDKPPLERSAQLAALTLQCFARCFIARQRVKHKREERNNAVGSDAMKVLAESDASTVSEAAEVLAGEQRENSEGLPSFPTQTEVKEEEHVLRNAAPSQPVVTEAIDVSHESPALPPRSVDVQPQLTSAPSDAFAIVDSIEMLPSAEPPSIPSGKRLSASTPPQEQRPRRDPALISTRMPSVLDVAKFFPPRRSLPSSSLAHTGGSSAPTEPVAITRKKVDIGSPPRARRGSQQEAAEQEPTPSEDRRKEEERARRAQVLEYQRIYAESRRAFETEKQNLLEEKLARDLQREHDAEVEKKARIQTQHERDAARARNRTPGDQADRLLWNHLKTQGRPTEQSVSQFRVALTQALDTAQFPSNMCAERARELHERIKRLHRASWAVDAQLEAVELRLLSELHPLTDRQRPLQAKYAAKLRCRLEQMLNTVQSWQRVLDEWEGEEEVATSRYWSTVQARYAPSSDIYTTDESRRQYLLNAWRGAAGGDSLLHVAAWNGWEKHVRLLLAEGADVNVVDSSASLRTPLHEACRAGHVGVVELLLRSGARLSAVDASGDSALHVACRGGWTRVIRVLLMAANDLGEEDEPGTREDCTSLTMEAFFNLRNGKGRRAVEVVTLPSLMEDLESK
ncbi:hypothetical protein PRIC1_015062 [Phytophthora ramorum]